MCLCVHSCIISSRLRRLSVSVPPRSHFALSLVATVQTRKRLIGQCIGNSCAMFGRGGDPFGHRGVEASVPQGRVVYQKSTSRVYNVHGRVGEETSKETDAILGTQTLAVTRQLGDRTAGVVHTRNLRDGDPSARDSVETTGTVAEADADAFDAEWLAQAQAHLPHYQRAVLDNESLASAAPSQQSSGALVPTRRYYVEQHRPQGSRR